MAILASIKSLLIPNKNNPDAAQPGYQTDMQTLEIWARQPIQQLVAGTNITLSPTSGLATDSKGNGPNPITISATGGGGGYASLTGPGEITTPGTLTQAGNFNVNGAVDLVDGTTVIITTTTTAEILATHITLTDPTGVDIIKVNGSLDEVSLQSSGGFVGCTAQTTIAGAGPLAFFDLTQSAGVAQKTVTGSRGGNAALASLLTALADYGLIINSTTP